jgi:drug/metabolite transporter (DMT)-like permease
LFWRAILGRALLVFCPPCAVNDVNSAPLLADISPARLSGNLRGMGWMALASTGFATNNAFVRYLTSTGLSALEIAFFVNAFGVIALTPLLLHYGPTVLRTQHFGIHLLRAICFLVARVFIYTALATTSLSLVAALGFTVPIITTILAIVFFHEVVRLRRWVAILFGFSGTFVILRPGLEIVETGSLYVLIAACFFSVMAMLAKLLAQSESSLTITAYTRLLPTPMALAAALFVWEWPTWPQLGILVLAGIVGTASIMSFVQAIKIGETNVVMPLDFSKLVWASLIGFVFFAEVPTIYTWIGGAMIFAAALYIAYRESQAARAEQRTATSVSGVKTD